MELKVHHSGHEDHDDREVTLEALTGKHRPSNKGVDKALQYLPS